MKLSVSLPDDDVALIDAYARSHELDSRSAVVQHALHLLRTATLERDYADAWDEWDSTGEAAVWDVTVGDGLERATR